MDGRRLPELAGGTRLNVEVIERHGAPEIQIFGNREGLQALASICSRLATLRSEDFLTPANHYRLDENFQGTAKGSIPLTVYCHKDDWSGWEHAE
jgi:hypothetical protein